jgi:hypothetical protein
MFIPFFLLSFIARGFKPNYCRTTETLALGTSSRISR